MYRLRLLAVPLILLLGLSFLGCDSTKELVEFDFEDTIEIEGVDNPAKPQIKICVGSMITPEEGYAYYKRLLDYLGRKLDLEVNFVEKRTYAEVNALLKNGSIDVAFVCGGPYVIGHDEFGLNLLAAPVVDGKSVYYSYIIVAKDSRIEKFEELEDKTFAFMDPLSNTGKLIPSYMLHEIGRTPREFFKETLYTYSHDNSIKAVAHGIVEAAAVDSLIWEYKYKTGCEDTLQTRIIRVSEPYGIPPVVARPGMEEEMKTKIKDILLTMHDDDEGKEILGGMFIDRFADISDGSYDTIRDLRSALNDGASL
ncbi:MAG: phosphate/phosphite/phosphonate ABC transporter substrate-binding protein [Candidatus Omnitrophica bacterium]|nr:phosphate/phosphite/phosphonate ABC transporter substrate-binding protein [Candidatus Omnitrophota bacterium]